VRADLGITRPRVEGLSRGLGGARADGGEPSDPDPFRHTMPRYPNITILRRSSTERESAPPFSFGFSRGSWPDFSFDRHRRSANPTLEWIRTCDLVVSVGGVNFQTAERRFGMIRGS